MLRRFFPINALGCLVCLMLIFSGAVMAKDPLKITYLFHSGWLIETEREVIVIDYIPAEGMSLDSVVFKKLQQSSAAGKRPYLLITHEHNDHFHKPLLEWRHRLKNLTTILGWKYATSDKEILTLSGRDSLTVGPLRIVAHPSTDIGSGFLITVGDLVFYHAGDHAAWSPELKEPFIKEVTFIRSHAKYIDVVFLPIAQGKFGGCKVTENITGGIVDALNILQPRVMFPMHVQCDDLSPYKQFVDLMKGKFPGVTFESPSANAQEFLFN